MGRGQGSDNIPTDAANRQTGISGAPTKRLSVAESNALAATITTELSAEIERRKSDNRYYDDLPFHGPLVYPDEQLSAFELAIAHEVERAFIAHQRTKVLEPEERRASRWVRKHRIWQALYDHHRDPETGDLYYFTDGQWAVISNGAEDWKKRGDTLPEEIEERLEEVSASSRHRVALRPKEGELPPSPGQVRKTITNELAGKGLPIVSSTKKDGGYSFIKGKKEMEELQRGARQAVETELARLDAQLRLAERTQTYNRKHELLPRVSEAKREKSVSEYQHDAQLHYAKERQAARQVEEKTIAYKGMDAGIAAQREAKERAEQEAAERASRPSREEISGRLFEGVGE